MPEIKNTFSQGKMNKDLDERLLPNGQYRHALNVDITSSEDSNAGVIKNIPGNIQMSGIASATSQRCVGSISDERNNKLYWFTHSDAYDGIFEFNQITEESRCVLVDKLFTVLKFSGAQITGINIIDDFLFFTDGFNEPKKINISKKYHEDDTIDAVSQTHARLFIDDIDKGELQERHVTVIKIKPSNAPTIKTNKAENEKQAIFEKVFPRFCFRYKYDDGQYSAFGPFTEVVFNADYPNEINSQNSYFTGEPYNKAMTNLISSVEVYDFVPSDIPEDVVQVDILYKQEDSNVVYSVKNIKYTDDAWSEPGSNQFNNLSNTNFKGKYVISSENIHAALPENQLLRPFDTVPKSALAQEIIGNRLVYGNYKLGYDFDGLTPGVDANYVLRNSQNFLEGGLKSIKSLRSYQLGVVLGDKYGRETPVFTSDEAGINIRWDGPYGKNASKSFMFEANINQDLPSWADYYKFYVKSASSEYYNLIMDKSYFPFTNTEYENPENHMYVSFPSSDRNKIMEDDYIIAKKIYDGSGSQVLLNNRYKILDISNEAPDAVKYIFQNLGTASNNTDNLLCNSTPATTPSLFINPNNGSSGSAGLRIDQETDTVHFNKTVWEGAGNNGGINGGVLIDPDATEDVENLYISWNRDSAYSERYKVSSARLSSSNVYVLKLGKKISNKDAKLAALGGTIDTGNPLTETLLHPNLNFKVEKRTERNQEDFSGKFFVKIQYAPYLTGFNIDEDAIYPTSVHSTNWLFDVHEAFMANGGDPSDGAVNSQSDGQDMNGMSTAASIAGVTGFCTTEPEWEAVLQEIGRTFFIDDMYHAGCNTKTTNEEWFAKESGAGQRGNSFAHKPLVWNSYTQQDNSQDGPMGINSSVNWDVSGWGLVAQDIDSNLDSVTPRPSIVNFSYEPPEYVHNNAVNSMEGIITTTNYHTGYETDSLPNYFNYGYRAWRNTLYATGAYNDGPEISVPSHYDTTYGNLNETGKYFIHISFLAPGQDLHDGSGFPTNLNNVAIQGPNGIGNYLQGIYGGGVFNKIWNRPAAPSGSAYGQYVAGENNLTFGNSGLKYVEFEGAYHNDNVDSFASTPPGFFEDNALSIGYDQEYRTRHRTQWDPWIDENGIEDELLHAFCNQLSTPGQKFRFSNDSTGTVFTILKSTTKHIYNHTTWRMRWRWDHEENSYERPFTSVEERASQWANNANHLGIPNHGGTANNLINKIVDFGRANNRRTCYIIEVDIDPQAAGVYDPRSNHGALSTEVGDIEFISEVAPSIIDSQFSYPTLWETEPQQLADLNIYFEASSNIPTIITEQSKELFAPAGCSVSLDLNVNINEYPEYVTLAQWSDLAIEITPGLPLVDVDDNDIDYTGTVVTFTRADGSYTKARIIDDVDQEGDLKYLFHIQLDPSLNTGLSWYNCFSFGDGIESNRIRDGFNKMQIASGARASATLEEPFNEEHRTNSLIYSGLYNSNSALNNLNQFIAAEKITKDLNPTYGDIQKLFTRSTDLVAFCEDRVLKILGNKDALFNADGNPQLVSTNAVLGQAVPFVGDYGISKNPESFAKDAYRAYFTDKQRGAVLRLSMDGLTPISDAGMRDYFRDNLVENAEFIGSFDNYNKHYNLTIKPGVDPGEVILEEEFNEGVVTEEIVTVTDVIENGSFTEGEESDVYHTIAEISDPNPLPPNPLYNTNLDSSTNLIIHPAVPVESIQTAITDQPGQQALGFFYGAGATVPEKTHFALDNSVWGDTGMNVWSDGAGGAVAGTTRFVTWRYRNKAIENQTLNTAVYTPAENDDNINGSLNTAWYNYADGVYPGPKVLDNDVSCAQFWDLGAQVYVETEGKTITPTSDTSPYVMHNSYHVSTTHKGITFRGTPNNGVFGGIRFPWSFLEPPELNDILGSGISSNVPDNVLEEYPNATDMTVFNGEELQLTIKFKANAYGWYTKSYASIILRDGTANMDASLLLDPEPVEEYGGGNPALQPFTQFSGNQDSDATPWPNGVHLNTDDFEEGTWENDDEEFVVKRHFKIVDTSITDSNGNVTTGIAINNFNVAVSIRSGELPYQGDFVIGETGWVTDGGQTYWTGETLGAQGEIVITEIRLEKIHKMFHPGQEFIASGNQPSIPEEAIGAWVEVQHNAPENVTGQNVNLTYGNELLYGAENPGTVVTGVDNSGVEYSYVTGTSNTNANGELIHPSNENLDIDWPSVPVYPEPAASITETVNGANSLVKLNQTPNAYLNLSMSQDFILDHWYLVDVTTTEPLQGTLRIPAVASNVGVTGYDTYGSGGLGTIYEMSNHKGFEFTTIDPELPMEYDPALINGTGDLNISRVLFRYRQGSSHYQDNYTNIIIQRVDSSQQAEIRSVNVLDVTDNNFITATASGWAHNGNQVPAPRAIVNGAQNTGYTLPYSYKKDGKVHLDVRSTSIGEGIKVCRQNVTEIFEAVPSDGTNYQVNFSLSENWLGEYNVNQGNGLSVQWYHNIDGGNTFDLMQYVTGDPGDYSFTLPESPELFNSSNLRFFVSSGDDTVCAIDNVSLMQTVITFDPGNAGAWVISGFNQTLYDYVTWNDGAIEFNEAPNFSTISQAVELEEGATYEISFDMSGDIDGTLTVSYFNLEGVGFHHYVNNISEEGHVSFLATVGSQTSTNEEYGMWGSFRLHSGFALETFTGIIDNVAIRRIYQLNDIDTHEQTITFSEDVKGWVSFKSFIPENALSLSSDYYTVRTGRLYKHNMPLEDVDRNTFYGAYESSVVTAILNQQPSSIKNFKNISYEGSQSRILEYDSYDSIDENGNLLVLSNASTYNLTDKLGWYNESIITDQQEGRILEFLEKEGKWFNYISGDAQSIVDLDVSKFNLQGLGVVLNSIENG
tara:strand:- start:9308 stop:17839 length:8532 start_codon:yes stop_codon:yes gene_type:complete